MESILATSVEKNVERASREEVVNPIWLLMMTCSDPPVL
jgi:hypothetical protein